VAGEVPYGGGETDRPAAYEEVHSLPVLRGGKQLTIVLAKYQKLPFVFIGLQGQSLYLFSVFFSVKILVLPSVIQLAIK